MNTQSSRVSTPRLQRQATQGSASGMGLLTTTGGEYFRAARACQPGVEILSDGWSSFIQRGLRLWPASCLLCGALVRVGETSLCGACEQDLPQIAHACPRCAVELAAAVAAPCGACQRRRPPFQSSFCAFRYDYPINHLIRSLKYHGAVHWGRALGELLARRLRAIEPRPTLVVPVPLAAGRFRTRGYNQAAEIAAVVARHLELPLCTDLVVRIRDTAEQAGLDGKARRKNVRRAFAVTRPITQDRVALIDDVITTGSTVREVARVLRQAGAREVSVWAVARVTQ